MNRKTLPDTILLVCLAGLIVVVDQVSKALVRTRLAPGQSWSPWAWLAPYARVLHTQNSGVAFGMLQGYGWIFASVAVVVALGVLYYFPRTEHTEWLLRAGMILLLGGVVGNLIDRVFYVQVTDFISVGNFAIFNVADAGIDVGGALIVLAMLLKDKNTRIPAENK